jgi:fibro-slime domain-containing protein
MPNPAKDRVRILMATARKQIFAWTISVALVSGAACSGDPAGGRTRGGAGAQDSPSGSGGAAIGKGLGGTGGTGAAGNFGNSTSPPTQNQGPPAADTDASVDAGVTQVRRDGCGVLNIIVRDFSPTTHPDFERAAFSLDLDRILSGIQGEKMLVEPQLEMGFPAYAYPGTSPGDTVQSPMSFYQWYVDDPSVNKRFEITLPFTETSPGRYVYDSAAFFPIDDMGFGNEGNPHNYHFTTEARTEFTYAGGEVFTFRGDDDLWMFVNGQLVIDLGGLHGPLEASVDLDAEASRLGLMLGETYPMDIFHAERHTVDSNYRIETNINCFVPVVPPPPPPPPQVD